MQLRQGGTQKKLADAARFWAAQGNRQGNAVNDSRAADPPEWQQALQDHEAQFEEDEDEFFSVWPENAQTVRVFIMLRRCWRQDGLSGQTLGIERPAIESTLRLLRIKRKHHLELFEQLMIMEDAALSVLNRK